MSDNGFSSVVVVQLSGCLSISAVWVEEMDAQTMSLSAIRVLGGDEVPPNLVVPLVFLFK